MNDQPELSSDNDEYLESDIFLRRIKACWIQRMAEALELTRRASLEEMMQIIERNLLDLQYQLQNVQVIIQDKDDGAVMFLANENYIIKCIECL